MRNTGAQHGFGDQKNPVEAAEQHREGEFSMASFQLDELLKELSREAGFKSKSGTAQKNSKKKGMITTKDGAGRTFLSWETEDGVGTFKEQKPTQMRCGYFSEADIDVDKTVSTSPKQKVINIEYRPKQRCYSAKVIEKTQTRQEYIKEEYLGNKSQSSGANRLEDQVTGTISVDGRGSAFGTLSNEMTGRQFQSQKMYSSDVEGIKVAPIPPPRKHIASPDPLFTSSSMHFQANKQQREQDFFSNTLSPVSSTSTLRKGRFETTNSQHLSPPLEVKGIAPASSTYEEQHWLEEQKKKLDRSRYSVDRITSSGRGIDHSFRSGSLDIDLDDLVQRNLTNRSVAVHQISSTLGGSEAGSVEKGSYYISGIERPAVRTKLPQTKYIFKITSPDDSTIKAPATKKVEKEVFTTHIRAPPIPPSPQLDPGAVSETNLRDLESSLKLMLDNTSSYKEEEHFNKKLRPKKDDEVISLEPIGPGVQLLEPEIGTLRGQTLRYQETGTPRMESRSNSLARHVATPRTLSPSNQGYNTLSSYPNQTSNYAMYETYSRQANSNPQQTAFQPQVPNNMSSHLSRKDTLEYVKPADNFAIQHVQSGSQQHQQQPQQQQHFQQQQQVQLLGAGYQPRFVPSPIGGGFRSEYSSMSYTQTLSNGPVSYPHSMPTSPLMGPKPLEYNSANQSQHEISVPIAVEGRKSNTSNTLLSDSSSQRHISSSASNYNHQESESSTYSINQAAKESDLINSSRQIPVIQEQAKASDAYVVKGSTGSLAGSYKLEDRVTESYTVVDNASHPASPDVNRSWTVSPSSNIVATNTTSYKVEGQGERRTESSNAQIVENQSASQISLTDYEAKLVRDTAHIWHKPHITRQEAVEMLRNKPSGSFVVRNSHSFAGGYGLALKVSHLPPNVQAKGDDYEANLVRHYLIESTPKGVKLKGCSNEPVFPSLSALIYQHSITPLSLPCKLIMPEAEKKQEVKMDNQIVECDYANYNNSTATNNNNNSSSVVVSNFSYSAAATQNANNNNNSVISNVNTNTAVANNNNNNANTTATTSNNNINNNTGTLTSLNSNFSTNSLGVSDSSSHHGPALYLDSFNTESLTGPEAMWKAMNMILEQNLKNLSVIKVDFRVSTQGVVLTDSKHKLFFRRHYPLEFISHCAVDQTGKSWNITDNEGRKYSGRVFGFVARKVGSQAHNTCHLFLEIDPKFSATTVVSLINGLQQHV